jgi:hypothetical protein
MNALVWTTFFVAVSDLRGRSGLHMPCGIGLGWAAFASATLGLVIPPSALSNEATVLWTFYPQYGHRAFWD